MTGEAFKYKSEIFTTHATGIGHFFRYQDWLEDTQKERRIEVVSVVTSEGALILTYKDFGRKE